MRAAIALAAAVLVASIPGAAAQRRGEVKPPPRQGGGRRAAPAAKSPGGDSPKEVEEARADLEIEWLVKVPHCSQRAQAGDQVAIAHKGYVYEVAQGQDARVWNGKQIDANPEGEFLNFTLRSRQILRGMDLAIEGMCEGEKIAVVIPPHLAYDDPTMFVWSGDRKRPAPPGSFVRYEISLVMLKGSGKSSGIMLGLAATGTVSVAGIGVAWLIARALDPGSQAKEKEKEKERKKRK